MFIKSYNEVLQMMFGVGRPTMLNVNILFKTSISQRIYKKNNQSLVSYADRKILTLGSMENARHSINLISSIIHLPSGWNFSVYIRDR